MRPLIGVDLNGVYDWLARLKADDEQEYINLGVRGGIIRLQAQDAQWLAGMQNEFAPHGRGLGWGKLGSSDNRVEMLKMLEIINSSEPDDRIRNAVTSSLPSLFGDSDLAVFAVPDIPAYGEDFRDRLLRLLNLVTGLRPLLLWRPVAALLGHIAKAPQVFRPGLDIAVLSLMADGIHLSSLSLESHEGSPLLVPLRNKPGQRACGSFRGEILVEDARSRLVFLSSLSAEEIEASAMSTWRYAIGAERQRELIRLAGDRGWLKLPDLDFRSSSPDITDLPENFLDNLHTMQVLLIEGPFAGNETWCEDIKAALKAHIDLPQLVEKLDETTVALGCLEAAKRYRAGQPIYFDFLPQLEINAMISNAPQFVDLIERGARCQGGELFRSNAPGEYVIDEGATRLTFWLFKEDFVYPRKAVVELPMEADRRCKLTVSVSQTPGQGFAEVQISSSEFEALRRSPITLNWASMEEVFRSRGEILRELEEQSQTGRRWPDTDVKPGHPFLWLEAHPMGNLIEQLTDYCTSPLMRNGRLNQYANARLETLRERFRKRENPSSRGRSLGLDIKEYGWFHALDSNGNLPKPASNLRIPARAENMLDETLAKCEEDLAVFQRRFGQEIDQKILSNILGFASWCFWRCPTSITELLLNTYEGKFSYRIHSTLLREGVARVVFKPNQLKRYFEALEIRLTKIGDITTSEYAGLARILGTVEKAAVILGSALAERLLERTMNDIADENNKDIMDAYKRRFKAALLMLAAILRHREAQENFLHPTNNVAKQLLQKLDSAENRNRQFAERNRSLASHVHGVTRRKRNAAAKRMNTNAEIIVELKEYIHLKGRDPNIIRRIDLLDEE